MYTFICIILPQFHINFNSIQQILTKNLLKSADYTRRKGSFCIYLLLIYRQDLGQGRRRSMARRGENIYHRKDGRWEGRYKSGYDESGKAKYRSVYGHSYAEVRAKLVPLKARNPGIHVTCRMTVKELFSEWLSAIKLRVKPSTYRQ